jgi:ribosomal protein S18 acetylase RimI-like enzyme
MNLSLRKLDPTSTQDVESAAKILNDGLAQKLRNEDRVWGSKKFTPEEILGIAKSSSLLIAEHEGVDVGTVAVTHEDARSWGLDGKDDETSLYLHKLATDKEHRGRGIGSMIIYALQDPEHIKGRNLLRLGFPASNDGLRSFYEGLGFYEVRETTITSEIGGFEVTTSLSQKDVPKPSL